MSALRLAEIHEDVIAARRQLRKNGISESVLDQIWNLTNEAFRRGCASKPALAGLCEYTEEEE